MSMLTHTVVDLSGLVLPTDDDVGGDVINDVITGVCPSSRLDLIVSAVF